MSHLIERIKAHEGYRRLAYRCPEGKLTIGYGTMIEAGGFGVPDYIAHELVVAAVVAIKQELSKLPWYCSLDPIRAEVIVEMAYQMGVPKVKGFKRMIEAIGREDWAAASDEMIDSRWYRQTPHRAARLAYIMRTGKRETPALMDIPAEG